MAKLLDADLTLDFPIARVEKDENGDLFVYGKATDGSVDSDEQIVDSDFTAKAIQDWLETGGNVRVQHSPYLYPAGVGVEVETNKDGGHWVKSKVIEPTAKKLVEEGVLRAYSVGIAQPKIIRDNVAKNGRVVGGRIVEISLVDRPANANCAVKLVKADTDGNAERVDELAIAEDVLKRYHELTETGAAKSTDEDVTKAHGAFKGTHSHPHPAYGAQGDDTTHSHEHSHDGDDDHGHGHGAEKAEPAEEVLGKAAASWYAEQDAVLGKRDFDSGVGGGVDRDKIPASDFAGPGRTFPIVSPGDVADAAHLVGHADDPGEVRRRIVSIAHRKGPAFEAKLPDSWKEDGKKAAIPGDKDVHTDVHAHREPDGDEGGPDLDRDGDGKAPATKSDYAMVRMHDALCAAFRPDDVLAAYPALKSVADAVADGAWREQLVKATEGWNLEAINEAAQLLSAAATVKGSDRDVLADARAELAKAFEEMYPDVHVKPQETITPGQFCRPYISAGHAPLHKADIPAPTHVPDADDFGRGSLNGGHAADSPGNDTTRKPSRAFYTNAARNNARSAMQAMHDHIAATFPDLCPMGTKSAAGVAQQDNGATNTLRPVQPPEVTRAPGEKADLPVLIKALVDDAMREEREYHAREIASLRAEFDKLGAEPDPAKAPVRGVVAKAAGGGQVGAVERRSLVDDARKDAAQIAENEYRDYLETMTKSGDPAMREQARALLKKSVTAD